MNSVAAGTIAGTVFALPHGLQATVYGTGMGLLAGGLYGTVWCARHLANEAALERDNFMSAEDAKAWGLIDEILEGRGKMDDTSK